MPVDHTTILRTLQPLSGGATAGRKQVVRHGDLVVTASLANGKYADTYSGIHVRILSSTAGELDANVFDFDTHSTFAQAARSLAQLPHTDPAPPRSRVRINARAQTARATSSATTVAAPARL